MVSVERVHMAGSSVICLGPVSDTGVGPLDRLEKHLANLLRHLPTRLDVLRKRVDVLGGTKPVVWIVATLRNRLRKEVRQGRELVHAQYLHTIPHLSN